MYIIKKKTVNVWHYYNNITGWNGLVDNATRYKYLSDAEKVCEKLRINKSAKMQKQCRLMIVK